MRKLFAVLALLAAGVASLSAQDITRGSIAGVVRDPSGAVVPGAKVTLATPNGSRATTTGSLGDYSFQGLIPGPGYSATVERAGFVSQKSRPVEVRINQQSTLDFSLAVGGGPTEQVEVTESAAEAIDVTSTSIGANLNEELYQNVPIQRNISSVVSMAPGVTSGLGTGDSNPSISGASGLENQYFINGANVTDPGYGAFGTYNLNFGSLGSGLTFDFIREVQVQSGGFEAQYGEALGGVVNVLTKSGTNNYHGDLFFYYRPQGWASAYPDANRYTVTQYAQIHAEKSRDVGADIGGYLIKNRLFWYAGFNPVFNSEYRYTSSAYANSALGSVPVDNHSWNYSAKLDFNLTPNHMFEGSVFGDPSIAPMGFQRPGSLAADNNLQESALDFGSRTWTVRYNGVLSRNWIVNANYSNYYNHFDETPLANGYQVFDNVPVQEHTGGEIIENGLGSIQGTESHTNQFTAMTSYNLNAFGGHTLDLGYQFSNDDYNVANRYTGADFSLPNLPAFGVAAGLTQYGAILIREHQGGILSNPIVLRVSRGNYSNPVTPTSTRYHAAFLQDSWVINRHLTIKPGIRFEYQKMYGTYSDYTFSPNWAPRIGFIFDPTGSRRSKIFANWGRFFEKVPLDIAVRSFSFESRVSGDLFQDQPIGPNINLSPSTYVPGGKISSSGGPDAATLVAGGTKAQYQDEVVAGYETQLSNGMSIGVRGVYRHLRRILEDISGVNVTQYLAGVPQQYVVSNPSASLDIFQNSFPCTTGANCDPSTGFTAISNPLGADGIADGFPNASRIYKAIELTFSKRFSPSWQVMANYRASKLYGNYEGLFRNDNGQSDPNITSLFDFTNTDGVLADQYRPGVLPTDRRHVLKIFTDYGVSGKSGQYLHRLNGLNFGLSWQIASGTPISQFLAHPAYDNSGEIPLGGRGSLGRTDWTWPVDAHVDYTVKIKENVGLKLMADVFNLFNQQTLLYPDQNLELTGGDTNPDFLKPYVSPTRLNAWQTPRYARIGIRLEF